MSTNHTTNYQLSQWEPDDQVLRADFNADNAAIDAALKNLNTGLTSKASTSELNSLQSTVNSKASQSELNDLKSTVTALKNTVSQKQDTTSALKIATGSYVGDGKSGPSNLKTLNFSSTLGKLPELLIVRAIGGLPSSSALILLRDMSSVNTTLSGSISGTSGVTVTWNAGAKSVSWYGETASAHFNTEGVTYYYFAIA